MGKSNVAMLLEKDTCIIFVQKSYVTFSSWLYHFNMRVLGVTILTLCHFWATLALLEGNVPSFMLNEHTLNGPSISVKFPNGYSDNLILTRHNDECNFLGHLEMDMDACVAMTGCLGQDHVELTILSKHSETPHMRWHKNGEVSMVKKVHESLGLKSLGLTQDGKIIERHEERSADRMDSLEGIVTGREFGDPPLNIEDEKIDPK